MTKPSEIEYGEIADTKAFFKTVSSVETSWIKRTFNVHRIRKFHYVSVFSDDLTFNVAVVDIGFVKKCFVTLFEKNRKPLLIERLAPFQVNGSEIKSNNTLKNGTQVNVASSAVEPKSGYSAKILGKTIEEVRILPFFKTSTSTPNPTEAFSLLFDLTCLQEGKLKSVHGSLVFQSTKNLNSIGHSNQKSLNLISKPFDQGFIFTKKDPLLIATGSVTIGNRHYPFTKSPATLDYTYGTMLRHTKWIWFSITGRLTDSGQTFAINLSRFIHLEPNHENRIWIAGKLCNVLHFDVESKADGCQIINGKFVDQSSPTEERQFQILATPVDSVQSKTNLYWIRSDLRQTYVRCRGTIDDQTFSDSAGFIENHDSQW